MASAIEKVLVTGATGYIGGRLVPRLLEQGYSVRCLARHPAHLEDRRWPGSEITQGDALRPDDLENALHGMDAAYYLMHSVGSVDRDFPRLEAEAAHNFARAASKTGVRRVVYLGGLGGSAASLSAHLTSRHAVGEILLREGPPMTEFRAAIIVGSGSLCFEMIRHIVEEHPIILRLPWLTTRCQPIAIRDVLSYLMLALELDAADGRIFQIGGKSIHSYEDMMRIYARRRGLTRLFIPTISLPPRLCATWIGMMTPIPAAFALPLIESLRHQVIRRDDSALRFSRLSLWTTKQRCATCFCDWEGRGRDDLDHGAAASAPEFQPAFGGGGLICEERRTWISAPPAIVFAVFTGIGGKRGWFMRTGSGKRERRLTSRSGALACVADDAILRRCAKASRWSSGASNASSKGACSCYGYRCSCQGKAWLRVRYHAERTHGFDSPDHRILRTERGFWGRAYWHALHLHHKLIFFGLARAIRERAEQRAAGAP